MDIIGILVIVLVVGLVLWAVSTLPIDAQWKQIARVIIIVLGCLWLLGAVGLLPANSISFHRCP